MVSARVKIQMGQSCRNMQLHAHANTHKDPHRYCIRTGTSHMLPRRFHCTWDKHKTFIYVCVCVKWEYMWLWRWRAGKSQDKQDVWVPSHWLSWLVLRCTLHTCTRMHFNWNRCYLVWGPAEETCRYSMFITHQLKSCGLITQLPIPCTAAHPDPPTIH